MSNKEKAISFLKMAGMGNVRIAYEKFIHAKFIHHNQFFKGDRESLMTAMEVDHKKNPNKSIEIKKIYEDASTVITHSLVVKENQEIVVVHIFRFDEGKIIELWDIGQIIDKAMPNENGLF